MLGERWISAIWRWILWICRHLEIGKENEAIHLASKIAQPVGGEVVAIVEGPVVFVVAGEVHAVGGAIEHAQSVLVDIGLKTGSQSDGAIRGDVKTKQSTRGERLLKFGDGRSVGQVPHTQRRATGETKGRQSTPGIVVAPGEKIIVAPGEFNELALLVRENDAGMSAIVGDEDADGVRRRGRRRDARGAADEEEEE